MSGSNKRNGALRRGGAQETERWLSGHVFCDGTSVEAIGKSPIQDGPQLRGEGDGRQVLSNFALKTFRELIFVVERLTLLAPAGTVSGPCFIVNKVLSLHLRAEVEVCLHSELRGSASAASRVFIFKKKNKMRPPFACTQSGLGSGLTDSGFWSATIEVVRNYVACHCSLARNNKTARPFTAMGTRGLSCPARTRTRTYQLKLKRLLLRQQSELNVSTHGGMKNTRLPDNTG